MNGTRRRAPHPNGRVSPLRPLREADIRRIAIVRLRVGLGDLLASVPALRALKSARPDAHVTMITWEEMAPVVERMAAYVDDLLPFSGYRGIPERPPRNEHVAGFLREARAQRFDLAVQMYGGLAAANEVTSRLGAAVTAGFFTPGAWEADLSTHLPYPLRRHEIHRHLMLIEFLGAPGDSDELEFPIHERDRLECDRLLDDHGLDPCRYVCIHAGATASSRRWLPERFAEVAEALASEGRRVVLTGVPGEAGPHLVAANVRSQPVVVCDRMTLGCFAALLQRAALLVTNDSGPAQLAAALRTPSVTVFLAGQPERWAGLDADLHRVVRAGVPCQPCGLLECPIDFRCAHEVRAQMVLDEAHDLLASCDGSR